MRPFRMPWWLPLFLISSLLLRAQTRETGTAETQATEAQPQPTENAAGKSESRGSLVTGITSARVALGPGDLLDVKVFDTPELSQRTRVNSDGKIVLTLIGELSVGGMAPDSLEKLITRKLVDGHFIKDPQVSVFVAEYAGQMAYVTGEVTRPGAYPLLRSHRLQDVISVAGGLTLRAGNAVTITRQADSPQTVQVDLSDKDGDRNNPEILPGDSITVGRTGIVYVLGDVERPGGFLLDRRSTLSVLQALALAEGTKSSASLNKVRLIRTVQEARQEIPLNLRAILKSQSPDISLQAGDILFIPGSLTRGMGRRSIDTILSTASGVAIYAYRP